ncbi:hypothetical protein SRABI98_03547 [Microbacterium sp. Bi98]|uniref:hypothetical protein n=1 Tax=Microbacterium sp. Bi98 TaxID=2821116 RepID=UPI001D37099B|nr:hypothetical protein [Microbacterium sp. Bi98]CAH0262628.1 hypothetical protein SRABI98_03547 [Microbacterium sp. Bi98]
MSSDTVRGYVLETLRPNLPADWKVEEGIPSRMHSLSSPLLWLEYTALEPLPEAPAKIAATVDVCIVTNKTDVRKGEADADESIAELYEAALAGNTFYGIRASKTVFWDAYFGWRLTLTVITKPTEE